MHCVLITFTPQFLSYLPSLPSPPYTLLLPSPWSPVCITLLLLGVRPALECGQAFTGHITKQSWLFFCRKLANANRSSARGGFHPCSTLGFLLAGARADLVHAVTVAASSCELLPCCERKWLWWYFSRSTQGMTLIASSLLCSWRLNCVMRWWWKMMAPLIFLTII